MDKLNLLLKISQKLFHTQDLAILWGIMNRNTLYTIIKRMVKRGVLIPVIKGLYSTVPISEIDKFQLGTALIHKFCYVSCETVLEKEGVISQKIYPITFVSSISQKIEVDGTQYIYRRAKPSILFNSDGIERKEDYFIAKKERAISDMFYFNPKYYLENQKNDIT